METNEILKGLFKYFKTDDVNETGERNRKIYNSLNEDSARYSDWGEAGSFECDGTEYNYIVSEDEAEAVAIKLVKNDLESEPGIFSPDWLSNYLTISPVDKRCLISEEENYIRERVEDQFEDEAEDVMDDDEEKEMDINKEVERRLEAFEEGLEDPLEYFVNEQGMYSLEDLLNAPFIQIDIDEAADAAVNMDGWSHFISLYDGDYETTENGIVIFREC